MLNISVCVSLAVILAIPKFGFAAAERLPKPVQLCLSSAGAAYEIDTGVRPYFLSGDFYGDGKRAHAVLVKKDGQRGLLICNSSEARTDRLGAGRAFNGMANLNFDSWKVYPRGKVGQGVGEGPPPLLRGDAIWIEWEESASAIVYWNGHEFAWYQQGD